MVMAAAFMLGLPPPALSRTSALVMSLVTIRSTVPETAAVPLPAMPAPSAVMNSLELARRLNSPLASMELPERSRASVVPVK